ncbi:hypothetical protein [Cellulomonas sp. SG140]|uniref:hypothetical protein n=1 Tax=Cellulomonas sp. SG140 TaxID=2976536 RepID=UPI0021E9152C|nr:hypothetical protein [Cellulomonas sp. SG140]
MSIDATGSTETLRLFAEDLRRTAVESAEASTIAVQQELARGLSDAEDALEDFLMSYAEGHTGAAPEPIDEAAKDAAEEPLREGLRRLGISERQVLFAGEEAGNATRAVVPNMIICRQDALDGTSPALLRWDGHASVCMIDQVRADGRRGGIYARHIAGAISCATGWVVSWAQWSRHNGVDGYRNILGAVHLANPRAGVAEFQLSSLRWDRRQGTLAAVAATASRRSKTQQLAKRFGISSEKAFYTTSGTPLAPALLVGAISAVIEPNAVSLHDSALLLPFQILGGPISSPDGSALNYLRVYEANALDLRASSRPVGGYIAWVK